MITVEELEQQIQEAKKGKAKVDSHYVGNASGLNHLFEYEYDYAEFLSNISYVIKQGKERKKENETYSNDLQVWMH